MVYQTPVILLFSLYIAVLLNQKFRGRWLFRVLFFIPVIAVSGIVITILNQDYLAKIMQGETGSSSLISVVDVTGFTNLMGIPSEVLSPLTAVVNDIFNLAWRSGIQILIFVAGLQTVPNSLYESAVIDGVTGWEKFWKITFPLITPMVLMNAIFTIVDNFTNSSNPVIALISEQAGKMNMDYELSESLRFPYTGTGCLYASLLSLYIRSHTPSPSRSARSRTFTTRLLSMCRVRSRSRT